MQELASKMLLKTIPVGDIFVMMEDIKNRVVLVPSEGNTRSIYHPHYVDWIHHPQM